MDVSGLYFVRWRPLARGRVFVGGWCDSEGRAGEALEEGRLAAGGRAEEEELEGDGLGGLLRGLRGVGGVAGATGTSVVGGGKRPGIGDAHAKIDSEACIDVIDARSPSRKARDGLNKSPSLTCTLCSPVLYTHLYSTVSEYFFLFPYST